MICLVGLTKHKGRTREIVLKISATANWMRVVLEWLRHLEPARGCQSRCQYRGRLACPWGEFTVDGDLSSQCLLPVNRDWLFPRGGLYLFLTIVLYWLAKASMMGEMGASVCKHGYWKRPSEEYPPDVLWLLLLAAWERQALTERAVCTVAGIICVGLKTCHQYSMVPLYGVWQLRQWLCVVLCACGWYFFFLSSHTSMYMPFVVFSFCYALNHQFKEKEWDMKQHLFSLGQVLHLPKSILNSVQVTQNWRNFAQHHKLEN